MYEYGSCVSNKLKNLQIKEDDGRREEDMKLTFVG